jgi:L-cysteine:1D-myo-inositol 2-amino-2-deoxy-alpha-D-glucopyranoside ligase
MRLYDTAARAVRDFESAGQSVSLYVCGITPYEASHLGHAFTYHTFDVLTRRLMSAGYDVRSVRNVTDVDDDILRVARERGVDYRQLVEEQVERFDREMSAIHILPVTAAPLASAHVGAMVEWIALLIRSGYAYLRDGWVYFDTTRFERYGALSRLDRDEMVALSRERGADPDDPRKRNPIDFVLWQPSLADEPSWDSPWGAGRPGWHIECSVLARDHLGATVDIHGGGEDLIYPHHESEIAQAEAVTGVPFARHWMHVAMAQLDGVKMSKSLGNLVFVGDLLRTSPPAAVRLLLNTHHYRQEWTYEADELRDAEARLQRYTDAIRGTTAHERSRADELERDFLARLDDDLDTPGALRVLDGIVDAPGAAAVGDAVASSHLLPRLLNVIGVSTTAVAVRPLVGPR